MSGTSTGTAAVTVATPAPSTFSVEAWFKTTTTSGGSIVGFGNSSVGTSTVYDRHVYLTTTGKVVFGVYPAVPTVSTTAAYNDGSGTTSSAASGRRGGALPRRGAGGPQHDITSAQSYRGSGGSAATT